MGLGEHVQRECKSRQNTAFLGKLVYYHTNENLPAQMGCPPDGTGEDRTDGCIAETDLPASRHRADGLSEAKL